jgi:hypothetical protein
MRNPAGPVRPIVARGLRRAAWLLVGLPLLLPGCAGYQLGTEGLYPRDVRTVCVPIFRSESFRRNLGERLTEAVCKEIERRSPYKVVNEANADSILTGTIVSEEKHLVLNTLNGDPRDVQFTLRVHVSWIDRHGSKLREDGVVPLPPEVADIQGTADVVPEVGQSDVVTQQEAINRVAKQIVDLMEAPW